MVDVGERVFDRCCARNPRQALSAKIIVCTVGSFLALGAADARAAHLASTGAITQTAPHSGQAIRDLGDLPPAPDSDNPVPRSASGSTVSTAEPVPELSTWAMMLLCLAGLGLAGFRKGRKERLSPGIE
jgi:hypothetical protein